MEKRRMEKRKKEKRKMERRMELRLGVMELFLCIALVSEVACEERTVRYKIFEEVRPPTVIGTLAGNVTWSPDTTRALSGIRFKLMSPSTGSFIRFRESDGRLTVEERVDRERICKRNARCVITFDVAFVSAAQFELFHVEVEILDVNDNSPVFPRAECAVEISESAALGTRIALDAAEDADVGLNSIQSYHLSENSHFSVDVITRADGVKYAELVLIKELDRESRARYALKLVALDGGHPEKTGAVNITINVKDSNDNSPRFEHSHYSVDVPEDTQTESLILALTAVDPDDGPNGQVVYEFGKQVTTKIRQLFKLDYKTGFLTLQSPVDYEDERVYEIDVRASDLGHNPVPSLCKVTINIIDVNDNPPEIIITSIAAVTDGVAHVSEATGADILVALIGIGDRDGGANGQVSCTLNGGYGSFRLKRAYEGSYTIVTMAPLDREKIAEYNLTVVAEDFGVPPLRTVTHYDIRLTDVNDNAPVFNAQIYEGFIEENQLPGTYITTIVASDQDAGLNGEITYELFDSDTNGVSRFAIMNQAGNVYALQSFNYEVTKRLDLRVQASDRGWPQLHNNAVLVINIVDQNDNAPIITHPPLHNGSAEVQLPRDAPLGYIATRITANDADSGLNAELSYALHDGSDLGFAIDPSTGEIYVNREIEEYDLWKLLVTVSDNGHPSQTSTATIHITLTESAPSNGNFYDEREEDGPKRWTLILILALTSFSLLFLVVLSYILCRSSKSVEKRCTDLRDAVDVPYSTEQRALDVPYSTEQNAVSVISSPGAFIGTPETLRSSVQATVEGFSQTPQAFKSSYRGDIDGYSTLPGYGKDSARPITVWKGNSMMTIAVREPQISGKDSGKGDSDVNDSDSDISEGLKRDYTSYKGLWACTSECRILGHSDRCWSPSVSRTSGSSNTRNLSTFSRARSSYDTQTARSVALHSLTEDQQSQYDYIHICSPQSQRRDAEDKDGQEFTHTSHSPGRFTDTA